MSRQTVNSICASLPGAEVSDPWGGGHDAWKIGGKMFASIGAVTPGVAIKTDSVETATMLIEMGVGTKAPYFHRSWVLLPWDMEPGELRDRIFQSYWRVRTGLPKKQQAELPDYSPE
ncbi:MmcQ/YjbR family DNA-binding protein [Hoeflea sp. YIM 152468]|uniref:MmcQ/YjbR family DNA-binding protein n=1 Tax=Hoeflea sp. YIM 152468 TaxID=3031759 RepID=UPI0023D9E1D6|nr:MmcQ/YjbR family DNA-binding protein [Hoeflea sp. YIM 152468]MDF1607635.1 MmcQ/YjbR family DNA-binding protein [Hoeflea sp. YIM 152468]